MTKNDFRYMRRGEQIQDLQDADFERLKPIYQAGEKKDRALLLLHGFSSSPAVYRRLLPEIKHYDAIVCPVLPGHADSIAAFSEAKASNWLQKAREECDALCKNYGQVDVLGLSLGGLLACKISTEFPIHRLFLLAPALKLHMNPDFYIPLSQVLQALGFKELRSSAGNMLTNEEAEISYKRLPLTTIEEMFKLVKTHQWTPPPCAVELFLGTHDEVVSSAAVAELFRDHPQTQIHWLENSAHVLALDNDLDSILSCINSELT